MKNKILNLVIITILAIILFALTGCGNEQSINIEENDIYNNIISNSSNEVIGEWKAIKTNNDEYSLGWLYGTSLTLANELKLNEDGTYSLGLGVTYAQEGKYVIEGDKIKLLETEYKGDNPDKRIAEELTINNKQIILVETEGNQKVNVIFNNINNIEDESDTDVINSDNENITSPVESTGGELKIGDKTIKYGTYKGIDGATGDILVINKNNTATLNGTNYTYKVGTYNFAQDLSGDSYEDAIIFLTSTGETSFALYVGNNGNLCSDPMAYVYSES